MKRIRKQYENEMANDVRNWRMRQHEMQMLRYADQRIQEHMHHLLQQEQLQQQGQLIPENQLLIQQDQEADESKIQNLMFE